MRDYSKLSPTFWTGATGKELRRRGSEGVVVALYLMSSPHSNMLGLYYQPRLYMAHETGLGIEGASKGLRDCIECGFCQYDDATEMVWVPEMAAYQIGDALASGDKRCKGIQKDFLALPNNPFVGAFFERYGKAFHLTKRHPFEAAEPQKPEAPYQAPSEPHRSQEQEQEQEQEYSEAKASGAAAPPARVENLAGEQQAGLPGIAPPAEPEPKPLTDRDRVWAMGPPLLGDTPSSRSLLGKLAATYTDAVLADVLGEAVIERPSEPKAWVTAACAARSSAKPKANGHEPADLLADPKPAWALQAGFPDRFVAENAGCNRFNAKHFRDGRRVAA